MKTFFRLIFAGVALVVLIAIALVVFVLTLDPNRLKPLLERQAANHGLDLQIPGDIRWRLFPNIGLTLGHLTVHHQQQQVPMAAVQQAAVSVQLMPLFRRQLLVDGITLRELEVHYWVDEQGNSAWTSLGSDAAEPAETTPSEDPTEPELAIKQLDIYDLKLVYRNAQTGDNATIERVNIRSQNITLDGTPFPLDVSLVAHWDTLPPITATWRGPVGLDLANETLSIPNAETRLRLGDASLNIDLSTETFWGEPLRSSGQVRLSQTALPALLRALSIDVPETRSPQAMQTLSLQLAYALDPQNLSIKDVQLQLDQTRLTGNVSVENFETPKIRTQWQGNHIAISDYLPPAAPDDVPPAPEPEPQPLPLEMLRTLDLQAQLAMERATYDNLALQQPQLRVTAKNGLIALENFSARVAEGEITVVGQLDARPPEAQLQMAVAGKGVDVGQLLQTFADLEMINGKATAEAAITSHGATDKALVDNLVVDIQAMSQGLRLIPFNLEEQFCRAISLLQQSPAKDYAWPAMTELEPVQMQMRFAQQTLKLNSLSAEIANLIGSAQGTFNLASGEFNVPLSLSLGDFAEELPGCLPIEERWRKRVLPIRCRGRLDSIGARTCLPDTDLIGAMVRERLTDQARQKIDAERERLEEKVGDRARDLLERKLDEEDRKSAEETARGLLNQLRGRR